MGVWGVTTEHPAPKEWEIQSQSYIFEAETENRESKVTKKLLFVLDSEQSFALMVLCRCASSSSATEKLLWAQILWAFPTAHSGTETCSIPRANHNQGPVGDRWTTCLSKINGHEGVCPSAMTPPLLSWDLCQLFCLWTIPHRPHCLCAAQNPKQKTKQNPRDTPNSKLKSKEPPSALCFDPQCFHLLFYIFVNSTLQSASRKSWEQSRAGCSSNSSCPEKAVFTCQLRIPRSSCCGASQEQCLQWLVDAAQECHSWPWGIFPVERKLTPKKGTSNTEMI